MEISQNQYTSPMRDRERTLFETIDHLLATETDIDRETEVTIEQNGITALEALHLEWQRRNS